MPLSEYFQSNLNALENAAIVHNKILDGINLEKTYQEYLTNLEANFPSTEDCFLRELTLGINSTLHYCKEIDPAVNTWKIMARADRMTVIHTFHHVFIQPLQSFTVKQKTIIFCKIFINEFVPLLLGN